MTDIDARAISNSIRQDLHDIDRVAYEGAELRVTVKTTSGYLRVRFGMPVGFRLLDEGDLLEFWPQCSLDKGWLYEVNAGGWMDLESSRSGFLTKHHTAVTEYLLVTQNGCLSLIAANPPEVTEAT